MKRIAIPIVEGKLSEYFGQCSHYKIFDIDSKNIHSDSIEVPHYNDITTLPEWALQQGITDIIAHKVDKKILSLFINKKINLFVGIPINTPSELIEDYMNGHLKSDKKIINEITNN